MTNGRQWALDIGNTRVNEYDSLEELFKVLKIFLEQTIEKEYRTKSKASQND